MMLLINGDHSRVHKVLGRELGDFSVILEICESDNIYTIRGEISERISTEYAFCSLRFSNCHEIATIGITMLSHELYIIDTCHENIKAKYRIKLINDILK